MARRSKGFTLIELLVVIAIIGILAAMVFPVFARARESARKAVCLSNVKNIGLAVQMYLADNNDTLWPEEHRAEVIAYFDTKPGGHTGTKSSPCNHTPQANPYLRVPVILDEYTKNRDVWRCPSAKVTSGARHMIPVQDFLFYWRDMYEGGRDADWGKGTDLGPCYYAWPMGWGGEVTDSIAQQRLAVPGEAFSGEGAANKAFVQGIGTMWQPELKMAAVQDSANFVICGDMGVQTDDSSWGMLAYPDLCNLECSSTCSSADWELCAESGADCGLYFNAPNDGSFLADPDLRKPFTRHLGGVNVGFLDGHAQWINSVRLITRAGDSEQGEDTLDGSDFWGPTSYDQWTDSCYPTTLFIY